jgi:hypothetical protein
VIQRSPSSRAITDSPVLETYCNGLVRLIRRAPEILLSLSNYSSLDHFLYNLYVEDTLLRITNSKGAHAHGTLPMLVAVQVPRSALSLSVFLFGASLTD